MMIVMSDKRDMEYSVEVASRSRTLTKAEVTRLILIPFRLCVCELWLLVHSRDFISVLHIKVGIATFIPIAILIKTPSFCLLKHMILTHTSNLRQRKILKRRRDTSDEESVEEDDYWGSVFLSDTLHAQLELHTNTDLIQAKTVLCFPLVVYVVN